MTELALRHTDGQNLAELRNYKLVQGQLFKNNGKNHYLGAAPYPVTAVKGDTWTEYDASNNLLEDWVYNGTIWLSKTIYQWNASNLGSGISAALNSFNFVVPQNTNILLLDLLVFGVLNATSSPANYWQFSVDRVPELGGALFNVTTFNTNSPSGAFQASNFASVLYPINALLNSSVSNMKGIRITESRPAGNSAKFFSYCLRYRRAR